MNLEEIALKARQQHIPVLLGDTAKFLIDFLKDKKINNILEIGTAIGYSGVLFLQVCKGAKLVTIDINQDRQSVAKKNFEQFGFGENVTLINGDAYDIIKTLNTKFDFIFLDGPKGQYLKYLPYLLELLNENGFLIADNIYFHGKVRQEGFIPHKHRTMVVNLRKFINEITSNKNLQTELFEIGDGISISKKI